MSNLWNAVKAMLRRKIISIMFNFIKKKDFKSVTFHLKKIEKSTLNTMQA